MKSLRRVAGSNPFSRNRRLLTGLSICGAIAGITAGLSCGRPDNTEIDSSMRGGSDYTPVNGVAAYGTQCPYGTVGGIKPLRLQLWNCPIGAGRVELTQGITPLYLQADCRDRILTVRTQDRKIDGSWYFMANGEFDVIVDGVTAQLLNDGAGGSNCNAPLSINLFGKVECGSDASNRDKATIKFQSVMWAGKRLSGRGTSAPAPQPSPNPNGPALPPPPAPEIIPVTNQCNLPQSCYFYTESALKQCL